MTLKVRFRPTSRDDLRSIYSFISDHSGPNRAWTYIQRIEKACRSLETFPNRGHSRDDLAPGIRTMTFEGRAIIAYRVDDAGVGIVRVIYAGRDYTSDDFLD